MAKDDGSILKATLIMLVLSVLLSWIPVVGPLAAGFIGGRVAGSVGRALVAGVLPAILAGAVVFVLVDLIPGVADWLAAIFAVAFTLWILVQAVLVLVGAALGGYTADEGSTARTPVVR